MYKEFEINLIKESMCLSNMYHFTLNQVFFLNLFDRDSVVVFSVINVLLDK